MDIKTYDDGIFYDALGMRLWERRHQFFDQYIHNQRILDIGCNDGKFLQRQSHSTDLELLCGLDIDLEALQQAKINLESDQIQDCIKQHRKKPSHVRLYHGSAFNKYQTLKDINFELVTLIEVIEHVHLEQLPLITQNVFGFLNPPTVIITTPNSDFNIYFKQVNKNFVMRHPDHKYEFTQKEFEDWANEVANQYKYSVTFTGVGTHRSGDMQYGYCSQIAVFQRLEITQSPADDLELQLVSVYECPYDARSDIQKTADEIFFNYHRYLINPTEEEDDICADLPENQVLIRIDEAREIAELDARYKYLNENHLILTLYQN